MYCVIDRSSEGGRRGVENAGDLLNSPGECLVVE